MHTAWVATSYARTSEIVCVVIGKIKNCGMPRSLTDWFKVIAAIAVVGIHATSQSETRFAASHDLTSLDFLGVVVNQWARFSVPIFLYLSAYGLAISNKVNEDLSLSRNWLAFQSRRLPTILVPYLFFSAIAIAMEFQNYTGNTAETALQIVTKLRTGAADYHLYFLVILAQCYLLFPLLMRFSITRQRSYQLVTWAALFLVALLLYKGSSEAVLPHLSVTHPGWHASFAIYWLPYFMLGILHAIRPPRPANSIFIRIALIIAQLVVLGEYLHYASQGSPVDYYNHFSRPSVMFYALVVVYFLHTLCERRARLPSTALRAGKSTPTFGERLAPLTFSVYLLHPQVLRVLTNYAAGLPGVFLWITTVVMTFILVYGLTLLTNKAAQKSPVWLTGPVQFFQRCLGLR